MAELSFATFYFLSVCGIIKYMCLTIPAKVISLEKDKAIVVYPEQGRGNSGKKEGVDTQLVKVKVGDYVMVSNGFAIKKVSKKEAEEIFKIINKEIK